MKKGVVFLTIMAIAAMLLAGCTSTEPSSSMPDGNSSPEQTSPTGTLTVLVTDAPSYQVDNVRVYFSKVEVHKAAEDPDGQGIWEEISLVKEVEGQTFFEDEGIRKIDLNAEMGEVVLAQSQVDAGAKYTQIRVYMYVDGENENHPVEVTYHEDIDGEAGESQTVPAKLPSGILKFVRLFAVEENGETSILLDFDLQKSVVFTGNFGKDLNPNKPDKPNVIVKPVVKLQVSMPEGEDNEGELYLYEKDPDDWSIVEDGASGKLKYNLSGDTFNFDFEGEGLEPGIKYSLIYYADPWPGDGETHSTGALINTEPITADGAGNVSASGFVDLNTDLPNPDDYNYDHDVDSQPPPGAKIWLVLYDDYDEDNTKMIDWNPTEYLFEGNTITYDDTDWEP